MQDSYVKLLKFRSAHDAIGKTLTVQMRRDTGQTKVFYFRVAAVVVDSVLRQNLTPAGLSLDQEDDRAVYDFVYHGTIKEGRLPAVVVVAQGVNAQQLKQELKQAGYSVRTAQDAQDFLNQIVGVLQIVVLAFGAITLVASFFGVVNTQYISVLERTREVGLMKALGMSRGTVSLLFIVEATWIGFLGAVLGGLVAIVVGSAINPWLSDILNFDQERLLIFRPLPLVGLVVFLMLVTTVAGLLPARKAAKLDPIEALRTE
jgi:putative ABC transport system permease protein